MIKNILKHLKAFGLKHPVMSAFLAGVFSVFGFAPYFALPVFYLMLSLVWLLADYAKTYKQAFKLGYAYGFGLFSAGFYWVGNALLVDSNQFGFLYLPALLASGLFFGLYAVPSFLVWHYQIKQSSWHKILSFASLWVLFEWVRGFFLTGFPWNMFGTMFAFHYSAIQLASIFGTYGLSFLNLLFVAVVYFCFQKEFKTGMMLFLSLLLAIASFGFYRTKQYPYQEGDIKIRLVQPSFNQQTKLDSSMLENNFNRYIELTQSKSLSDIDFVIWGETAIDFDPERSLYHQERLTQAVPLKGYLITGLVRYDASYRLYNSLYVLDHTGQKVDFYDKSHLVPFGEYIPLRRYLPKKLKAVSSAVADFEAGQKYKNITLKGYPSFGALICYEIIFPDQIINRQNKPSWLALLTNDAWYGNSSGPYQHLVAAQMRAAEEGISIVRSANSGISALIDPLGKVHRPLGLNQVGIQDVKLPLKPAVPTLYNYTGNKLILSFMALLFLLLLKKKNLP